MVILGGPGTLLGPLAGSVIIVFVREFVSSITDRWLIVLGLAYVCTVLFFPNGLIGALSSLTSRRSSQDRVSEKESIPESSKQESSADLASTSRSQ